MGKGGQGADTHAPPALQASGSFQTGLNSPRWLRLIIILGRVEGREERMGSMRVISLLATRRVHANGSLPRVSIVSGVDVSREHKANCMS